MAEFRERSEVCGKLLKSGRLVLSPYIKIYTLLMYDNGGPVYKSGCPKPFC